MSDQEKPAILDQPESAADFASLDLDPQQLRNLQDLGYLRMTPIQAQALPLALAGKDLLAQAATGSGKTAAFSLPLLSRLNPRDFSTQALVICPTRELATQVATEIRRLARHRQNIKVVTLCGGQGIGPQIGSLQHGAHVVVGTPGRLLDHLRKQTLTMPRLRTLVLDEADRMLEMGFAEDVAAIVEATPQERQTLLFSATYPENIQQLGTRLQRDPQRVTVQPQAAQSTVDEAFYICSPAQKSEVLLRLLRHYTAPVAVIFCNTKETVRQVTAALRAAGHAAQALHGDMEQRDRDQVLLQFRQLSIRLLVATDVAARGLDIDDLPAVINYDLPRSPEVYVHRIGRTGRAGKGGLALTVFSDKERFHLDRLGEYLGRPLEFESVADLSGAEHPIQPPDFVTLCIAGGRRDKVRPGDILGALTGEAGIPGAAVGKIDVLALSAYVAVERRLADTALQQLRNGRIKGRKFKVRKL